MIGYSPSVIDREALREWYSQIGRKGGSVKSQDKTRSARRNGRQGGRPTRHVQDIRELLADERVSRWLFERGLADADASGKGFVAAARRDLGARRWQGGKDPSKALSPDDVAHAVAAVVTQSPKSFISEVQLRPLRKP